MCALLSELSINCRLGASYGHAGELVSPAPVCPFRRSGIGNGTGPGCRSARLRRLHLCASCVVGGTYVLFARCTLSLRSIADRARFMAMPGRLVFTRPCMSSPPIRNWKRYRPGTSAGPTTKATPLCIMRRLGGMPKVYRVRKPRKRDMRFGTGPGCSEHDTPRRIAAAGEGAPALMMLRRSV